VGFIGIQPKSNVEIKQQGLKGVAITKIDVSEIPPQLARTALNYSSVYPLYLAYKFLSPIYQLVLLVTKHNDVDVLIAAVDFCQVRVTIVPEGKLIYLVSLRVRNTEKQYVRIDVQDSEKEVVTIWSTSVNGTSVKPARDENGQLLIPLIKRSSNKEAEAGFNVELSYMLEIAPLKRSGNLRITFPKFDILLSQVSIHTYFPITYTFNNYGGNIEHFKPEIYSEPSCTFMDFLCCITCCCLCRSRSQRRNYAMEQDQYFDNGKNYIGGEAYRPQNTNALYVNPQSYSVNVLSNIDDNVNYDQMFPNAAQPTTQDASTISGVIPIKVEVPTGTGKKVEFRRLMVKNEHLYITSSYRKNPKTKTETLMNCLFPCV